MLLDNSESFLIKIYRYIKKLCTFFFQHITIDYFWGHQHNNESKAQHGYSSLLSLLGAWTCWKIKNYKVWFITITKYDCYVYFYWNNKMSKRIWGSGYLWSYKILQCWLNHFIVETQCCNYLGAIPLQPSTLFPHSPQRNLKIWILSP